MSVGNKPYTCNYHKKDLSCKEIDMAGTIVMYILLIYDTFHEERKNDRLTIDDKFAHSMMWNTWSRKTNSRRRNM